MSNKGNAYAIALSLFERDREVPFEQIAENIYHTVEVIEFGSDERKADLYAQLAEKLTPGMGLEAIVDAVEIALDNTDRRFPCG